ncbi:MAG: 23S rRNA (uracil(1939)-C(5))-methyltransferase RlmD [Thiohalospira sp.]
MARRKRLPAEPVEAPIEALSHEGRGIARIDGKVTFIDGALPGERVRFRYTDRRRNHDAGRVEAVLEAAADRVEAPCPHFGVCGGCSLQHLDPAAQVRFKAEGLMDQLERLGGVAPEVEEPPLTGPLWGYRRRARLGAKRVPQKGGVLVGFRERGTGYVVDTRRCDILDPRIGEHIPELARTIDGLTIAERVPQVEVALGDEAGTLVIRHLDPLGPGDAEALADFGRRTGLGIHLQPGDESTAHPLWPEGGVDLRYAHPAFGVELAFAPTDFIQVNAAINRDLVARVVELLDPQPGERVLDLFCGLGNFSLPLASRGAEVTGVEGAESLVARARENAEANGLAARCRFLVDDLDHPAAEPEWGGAYDAVVLDPARAGARAAVHHAAASGAARIAYVSCNPATLARDAGDLAEYGFRLARAGVVDMFPHTAHAEAMALFER